MKLINTNYEIENELFHCVSYLCYLCIIMFANFEIIFYCCFNKLNTFSPLFIIVANERNKRKECFLINKIISKFEIVSVLSWMYLSKQLKQNICSFVHDFIIHPRF